MSPEADPEPQEFKMVRTPWLAELCDEADEASEVVLVKPSACGLTETAPNFRILRLLILIILACLPACTGPGAIRTSEIRPLLTGDDGTTGILGRHDAYARARPASASPLRQSQAVRYELEAPTTTADQLKDAGLPHILQRHDAWVEEGDAPQVLKDIWLDSTRIIHKVLEASEGE